MASDVWGFGVLLFGWVDVSGFPGSSVSVSDSPLHPVSVQKFLLILPI